MSTSNRDRDINPDPITGEPGSHPVGTGIGAAGGAATGAAVGAAGGPVGSAVGAAIGAVAGGLAGKGVAEHVDPTAEDAYWRTEHTKQPYAKAGSYSYDDYSNAYRTGYEGYGRYEPGTRFEDAESTLREDYVGLAGGRTALDWENARPAARAAWDRVHRGDAVRVQLSEEQLKVGKREVEGGAVRLRKVVRTENVSEPVELKRDEVTIDRVTAGNLGEVPADAFQEGTIEVPLTREEAVVEKSAHVVGEVRLKKNVETDTQTVRESLRKEDVEIEREGEARIARDDDATRRR